MKALMTSLSLVALLGLSGCANMNNTEQRALSGAAIGAGAGAIIGAATGGNAGTGAAIGAAAGGLGGLLYDRHRKSEGEPDY